MQVNDINTENTSTIFPLEIYSSYLWTIRGISFTHREIDTIACVLGGRSNKKIASLLSISPKTVDNHIRNIMLKLGLSSRGGLIDVIEKSGKYTLFKKYYLNLLAQEQFELALVRIRDDLVNTNSNNNPSMNNISVDCNSVDSVHGSSVSDNSVDQNMNISSIVVCDDEKTKSPVFLYLKKHLNLLGINIIHCEITSNNVQDLVNKINKIKETSSFSHIIYCLSTVNAENTSTYLTENTKNLNLIHTSGSLGNKGKISSKASTLS